MKQNVSPSAAVAIIVAAVAVFFLVFNKPAAPVQEIQKAMPFEPQVEPQKVNNIRKGLGPLGTYVVFPPSPADRNTGVRVAMVRTNSPAGKAGLKAGDLIVSFDGEKISGQDGLIFSVSRADPKKAYPVEFVRDGKTEKVSVSGLVPLPPEELAGFDFTEPGSPLPSAARGRGRR